MGPTGIGETTQDRSYDVGFTLDGTATSSPPRWIGWGSRLRYGPNTANRRKRARARKAERQRRKLNRRKK